MKKIGLYTITLMLAVTFFGAVPVSNAGGSTEVLKNFIKINSVKYRRAGADSADLASIGEKLTPVGKVPRFDRQFSWKSGSIQVIQRDKPVKISTKKRKKLGGKFTALIGGNNSVSGEAGSETSVDAEYFLLKLEFADNFSVVEALNKDKKTLANIKSLRKSKARIVSSVWVLVSGTETQASKVSGTLTGNVSSGSGEFTLKSSSVSTFSFPEGSVMAYEIDKFKWTKKMVKIDRLMPDQVWR